MRSLIDIVDFSVEELQQLLNTACDIIEYLEEDEKNAENVQRIKNYLVVNGAKA